MLQQRLTQTLASISAQNLRREPVVQPAGHSAGQLNFCSNDYLGLARHPEVLGALQAAAEQYGVGSTGSHLISGHHQPHHELEAALAEFTGREAALTFSTGYMANMGVIDALAKLLPEPLIMSDQLNHASLIDGCRLSKAQVMRYPHAEHEYLHANAPNREHLLVTDGLFSMDGDLAPLPELVVYAKQRQAWLVVDDAHGFGVLGEHGGGCCEHFGLSSDDVPVLLGTFGKALGTAGAFVAGSRALIEYFIQRARPYIYTTAPPPAIAAATLVALRLVQDESWRREQLQSNIQQFKIGARQLGLQLLPSNSPIQPIIIGDASMTMQWSAALLQRGLQVTGIRPPTVPAGTGRLRVTLSAAHDASDIAHLLEMLRQVQQEQL